VWLFVKLYFVYIISGKIFPQENFPIQASANLGKEQPGNLSPENLVAWMTEAEVHLSWSAYMLVYGNSSPFPLFAP